MSHAPNPAPREPEPGSRNERRFDRTAMLLAAALAAIVLGALAYGILKPPKVSSSVPLPNEGSVHRVQTVTPKPDPVVPAATAATGGDGPADRAAKQ